MPDYLQGPHLSDPYLEGDDSMVDHSKIIFVNANGDFEETSVADSLQFASFKTASFELTDTLLGKIVNAIVTSAGVADADKFVLTDASGKLDSSLINEGDIDHGSIGGLGDDDHTQYILVDGTRAFTGAQSMGGFKVTNLADGTADSDAINYGQLLDAINGMDWKDSVRIATTAALAASTYANGTAGVGATLTADANGAWPSIDGVTLSVGQDILVKDQVDAEENGIYELTDAGGAGDPWVITRRTDADEAAEVTPNMTVSVEEGTANEDRIFQLSTDGAIVIGTTGLTFIKIPFNALTGGAGIEITGEVIAADLLSGGGLKFVGVGDAGELSVEPDDFAGEGLIDDGSDNLAIDWSTAFNDSKAVKAGDLSSVSTGFGASIIGLEDAGGYTSQTDVEGAIQEIYGLVGGYSFTVGAGGVTKGALVYVSADNTVLPMPINALHRGIGLALTTEAAAGSVGAQASDFLLTGVLTGATAGDRYYWNGTALTTTIPAGGGAYVWAVGVAANATDLLVNVEFIKRNA